QKKKGREESEGDRLEDDRRRVRNDDEQFAAEGQPPYHRRVVDDARRRAHQALVESEPRQQSRDEKVDVVVVLPCRAAEHVGKEEPIEEDQAERLKHGPEDAEGGAGKARVEVSFDEFAEEMDVSVR